MITVYSYYVLDLVHRGHLLMMKNSKAIAGPDGRLIVGIVSDEAVLKKKGNAPILSFSERLELASAIKYADVVVGQQNYTPYENIEMLKFREKNVFDEENQINSLTWYLESDGVLSDKPYFFQQRMYYPHMMDILFEQSGLKVLEKFGDWDRSVLEETSPLQIYICSTDN